MNNSDILFLYDAKLCNPNGDPDEENKPRMDDATGRNLVSDVRLKRYLRDYWTEESPADPPVWVAKVNGKPTRADTRYQTLRGKFEKNHPQPEKPGSKSSKDEKEAYEKKLEAYEKGFETWLLSKLKDIRFFGATITTETPRQYTGPVQFTWGYSINRAEIVPSSTISSTFSGRTEGESNLGKDWRIYYSLIAFHGIVSSKRAEHTQLSEDDLKDLDNSLLKAVYDGATTRSKIGQMPRFYLRAEYKKGTNNCLRDMRSRLKLEAQGTANLDTLRDISDYVLDITPLLKRIEDAKDGIEKIVLFQDADLITKANRQIFENDALQKKLQEIGVTVEAKDLADEAP